MRRAFAIGLAAVIVTAFATPRAFADTVGTDETRAGMCDGFEGLPFVFCVAMCEARECDRMPSSDERCAVLAQGFASVAKGVNLPCPVPARGSI